MQRPKLLILSQLFYPELISTGQTLTELGEALQEIGVDIEVVCGPPTVVDTTTRIPRILNYKGIRIRRVWSTRFRKLNTIGRIVNNVTYAMSVALLLACDRSERLILVLTNPPFLGSLCGVMKWLGGNRYVYLVFDVYPETAVRLGLLKPQGLTVKLWNLANKIAFDSADCIVTIGRCMQAVVKAKLPPAAHHKVRTIPVWCDDKTARTPAPKPNRYLKEWSLEGKFVLGYAGNMGRFHDVETIAEAADALGSYRDILFLFVGEGYKKAYLMACSRERGLTNCQFRSYVPRDELGIFLSCIDVGLVSLAKGQEGLSVPSKTFALMAAGIPIIAIMSHTSEIAMLITEEKCGIVVEPGDWAALVKAVLDLYSDHDKRYTMGRCGSRAIDTRYNLRAIAEEYYALISALNEDQTTLR